MNPSRYAKQRIFLGAERESRLHEASVVLVGLGATGCVLATWLARAGIKRLRILDRDIVEESNLSRQCLYTTEDLLLPKAERAARQLRLANPDVEIEAIVADLTAGNARQYLTGFDLMLDGTDNFEARFLINDMAILTGQPWIYTGAIGGEGMVWPIHPPHTPCLRCLMEEPPVSGDVDTCDSAGVLGPTVGIMGSWAAMEAIKILSGEKPHQDLVRFDFWKNERQFLKPPKSRCPYCQQKQTEFLDAKWSLKVSRLCGLEGVQIRVNPSSNLDLEAIKGRLEQRTSNTWKLSSLALSGEDGAWRVMLFKDGRAIIHGDISPERARGWYSEVVGC